jgi:hypothetical protein
MKLGFSRQVSEKSAQISNVMKIRRVGAELYNQNGDDLAFL